MNIVTVRINGIEYNLKGQENDEYLHTVASYVDKKIKTILENNKKLSTSSAAVLSAVNVVDDMFKRQKEYEKFLENIHHIQKKQKDYELEIESLKKQVKHMEEYNSELQLKLRNIMSSEELEQQVQSITKEMEILQETARKYMNENTQIKSENKEIKFQLQSAKYKMIDLEQKLIENQISLAKQKKQNNSLLSEKIK